MRYIKNHKNLKVYWKVKVKEDYLGELKHQNFLIDLKENRSLLGGPDHAYVTQVFSYKISRIVSSGKFNHFEFADFSFEFAEKVTEGKPDLVYNEVLLRGGIGNHKEEFKKEWKKAKYKNYLEMSGNRERFHSPFSVGSPAKKISEHLIEQNIKIPELTDKLKQTNEKVNYENVFNQIRGNREIGFKQALEYSKILGIDPAELLFDDLHTHVWGKVDLLTTQELEDYYEPGRIFTYYTHLNDAQIVNVPRNIWRPDIKAIRIDSPGSMYHSQVAFYYRSKDFTDARPNDLCVMAFKHEIEQYGIDEMHYYFGLYESKKGKINLINPDPYRLKEYILQDCKPLWTAPIVAMITPSLIKKDKIFSDKIKDHQWYKEKDRDELQYKRLVANLKDQVKEMHAKTKQDNNSLKKTLAILRKWREGQHLIASKLRPDLFRNEEEELKRIKEGIVKSVEEHFKEEERGQRVKKEVDAVMDLLKAKEFEAAIPKLKKLSHSKYLMQQLPNDEWRDTIKLFSKGGDVKLFELDKLINKYGMTRTIQMFLREAGMLDFINADGELLTKPDIDKMEEKEDKIA